VLAQDSTGATVSKKELYNSGGSVLKKIFRSNADAFDSYVNAQAKAASKLNHWSRGLEIYGTDSNVREGLLTPQLLISELIEVYGRRAAIVQLWQGRSVAEQKGREQVNLIDRYCSELYELAKISFRKSASLSLENVEQRIGEIALTVPRLPIAGELVSESARAGGQLMEQFKTFESKGRSDKEVWQAEDQGRIARKGLRERESERLKDSAARFEHAALKVIEYREGQIQKALDLLKERSVISDLCKKIQLTLAEWKRAETGMDASKRVSQEKFDASISKLKTVVRRLNYLGNPKPEDQKPGYNEGTWRETLKGQVVNLLSELERFGNSIGRVMLPGPSNPAPPALGEHCEVSEIEAAPPPYDSVDLPVSRPRTPTEAEERRIALEASGNRMLRESNGNSIASRLGR
jgi:hypothetical protein